MRMDVTAPTSEDHASLLIYPLASREDVKQMAFGCDADVGGLSSARLELDPEESKGRFFGTLSSELPRGAKIERSGYAGIRNKVSVKEQKRAPPSSKGGLRVATLSLVSTDVFPYWLSTRYCHRQTRTTLFGCQTWDTTDHPFLRLRVRNRLAGPPSVQPGSSSTSSSSTLASSPLRSALSGGFNEDTPVSVRAAHALGLNLANRPGPKFFVNVQTDGPVTSDLFQHRLVLDESKGNAWQDVIVCRQARKMGRGRPAWRPQQATNSFSLFFNHADPSVRLCADQFRAGVDGADANDARGDPDRRHQCDSRAT